MAIDADWVRLERDGWLVELIPALGGSIAGCRWRHPSGSSIDLLRPASAASLATAGVNAASCFPLTPFSNRLRDGRCNFRGREIVMPRNTPRPHVEHGHGWQRPWTVTDAARDIATLTYRHEPNGWPFAYEMRQTFRLDGNALAIELRARNLGPDPMPYGFGLHPYFPFTPGCRLTARVAGMWETDAEVMPTRLVALPARLTLPTGCAVAGMNLDNGFTGWDGRAVIDWPEWNTRLTMAATAPLRFLVLYTPAGGDHFCVEPVSNCTDAFNLAGQGRIDTGMLVLESGQEIVARVTFAPSMLTS
jgi:aldose 1-epimerase